ncbi:MAG: hypothetical protein HQ503_09765 [Rhodospirillales bacterium]|nr:hypothetical protein [Rhodospirillales bacterium]
MDHSTINDNAASKGITTEFWPLVVSGAPAENLFYCVAELTNSSGKVLRGDDALIAGSTERVLDQARLTNTVTEVLVNTRKFLKSRSADGKSATAVVPINAVALSLDSFATAFAKGCRQIAKNTNGKLVFELSNLPGQISLDYLDNLSILMFPFCRHYIARPNPAWTDFSIFTNCNFQGISFHLKDKAWPTDQIQPHLEKFCRSALENRLDPYIHGVENEAILNVARRAGFKYLDGSGVHPPES